MNDPNQEEGQKLVVGTFNTPELFLLSFQSNLGRLEIEKTFDAIGNHSWLGLDQSKQTLLATCWTDPPCIASYKNNKNDLQLKSTQTIKSRSGYVAVHHVLQGKEGKAYTAGGPSGEVLGLDVETGMLSNTLQEMNYVTGETFWTEEGRKVKGLSSSESYSSTNLQNQESGNVLDFGGLRHGSHSIDLSPDARLMYVADIGRNCVWVHELDEQGLIDKTTKVPSPRSYDGPRHVWPHPLGKYVYVLQEHSSMVDVFEVQSKQDKDVLKWVQGVRIIPENQNHTLFWADEVRTVNSVSADQPPEFLVASTRGLESETKGYVTLFKLTKEGLIDVQGKKEDKENEYNQAWLDIWQTPTSGGWANAVEPCYKVLHSPQPSTQNSSFINQGQYIALTDSEEGLVIILTIDVNENNGEAKLSEISRVELGKSKDGKIRGAATAVWL